MGEGERVDVRFKISEDLYGADCAGCNKEQVLIDSIDQLIQSRILHWGAQHLREY